jgi:hypothetical protein
MTSGPENNAGTFQNFLKTTRDQKMMLRSVAIYGAGSDRRYAAVWHANPGFVKWHVHPADTAASYQVVFNAETQLAGYELAGYRRLHARGIARRLGIHDQYAQLAACDFTNAGRFGWPDAPGARQFDQPPAGYNAFTVAGTKDVGQALRLPILQTTTIHLSRLIGDIRGLRA